MYVCMYVYSVQIYLLCMIKFILRWCICINIHMNLTHITLLNKSMKTCQAQKVAIMDGDRKKKQIRMPLGLTITHNLEEERSNWIYLNTRNFKVHV